jgi:hypothetical protein
LVSSADLSFIKMMGFPWRTKGLYNSSNIFRARSERPDHYAVGFLEIFHCNTSLKFRIKTTSKAPLKLAAIAAYTFLLFRQELLINYCCIVLDQLSEISATPSTYTYPQIHQPRVA